MADSTPKSYHTDPNLYLYTSLTSGSSHIITATSRLETILKANKIPFIALDVATDEKARMLWGRRAGKRKLPGLVRMAMVVADLEEVEEWNEYGEIKENLGSTSMAPSTPSPSATNTPSKAHTLAAATTTTPLKPSSSADSAPRAPPPTVDSPLTTALRQAGYEAARIAGGAKSKPKAEASEPKSDNSTQTGIPSPSGAPESSSTTAPKRGESSAELKADTVPATSGRLSELTVTPDATNSSEEGAAGHNTESKGSTHRVKDVKETESSNTTPKAVVAEAEKKDDDDSNDVEVEDSKLSVSDVYEAGCEDAKSVTKEEAGLGVKEAEHEAVKLANPSSKAEKVEVDVEVTEEHEVKIHGDDSGPAKANMNETTAATKDVQVLPGRKTQDQPAASAKEAEESVAD